VALVAPATVKKSAVTPVSVKPAFAVSVMVAVYSVLAANIEGDPFQVTAPVYCAVSAIVVTGVESVTGAVTPGIAAIFTADGGVDPVVGKTAVTIPESVGLVSLVAPDTVKKFAETPVSVYPALAVSSIVAV